jgi:PKD repeat protein
MRGRFILLLMGMDSRAVAVALLLVAQMLSGCGGMGPGSPNANINADRETINAGETVNFDARDSTSPEPTIIDEYRWDFGDGDSRTTKQAIVSHMFSQPGSFVVQVVVANDEGSTDSASISIFVNAPPEIVLEMPDFVKTGQTALLDASSSTDYEGGALEFMWDFDAYLDSNGDGDPLNDVDQSGAVAEVTYNETGNHTGAVTVVDDNGATTTSLWTLRVLARTFRVIWEETHLYYDWSGYLEQGTSYEIEHYPGEGARVISVSATLTLARDLLPIQWPEDNFTLGMEVPLSGLSSSTITTHDNITENASAYLERMGMNSIPESGYTITADSKQALESSLLNQPGERVGQGVWEWTITALQCDPDLPIDGIDPDQGNDWTLEAHFVVLILRISEVGI